MCVRSHMRLSSVLITPHPTLSHRYRGRMERLSPAGRAHQPRSLSLSHHHCQPQDQDEDEGEGEGSLDHAPLAPSSALSLFQDLLPGARDTTLQQCMGCLFRRVHPCCLFPPFLASLGCCCLCCGHFDVIRARFGTEVSARPLSSLWQLCVEQRGDGQFCSPVHSLTR